jgi:4-hydroxy 2-oxovalerate aldolase
MIKLLDCTLRDGGYYTNWDFDSNLVLKYLKYMETLPVEYLEVGYRSIENDGYFGEYYYLPLETLQFIKSNSSKKIAIMLNSKEYDNKIDLSLLDNLKDYVDLVRLATDPSKIKVALKLAKEIKKKGFKVAINIMYISKINKNNDFYEYLTTINEHVDILNLVDSYGSIYPEKLKELILEIKCKSNISLGFHGHNNLELAFINTLTAINLGIDYVDSTILGMGRGAGNLKTELILTYLKSNQIIDIDLNPLGKLSDTFKPLLDKYNWGTNLAYMVSGGYSLQQKNVMDALEIDRYSLSGIISHIKNGEDTILAKLTNDKQFKSSIIIGGGNSIKNHIDAILRYLSANHEILVIHSTSKYIRYFENIKNTQYFAVAGDELLKLDSSIKYIEKYILEPTPRKIKTRFDDTNNFYELKNISFIDKYFDSPLTISLQIMITMNIQNINLIGFDGYKELKSKKELYLMTENQNIIDSFITKNKLTSLTDTQYDNLEKSSIYGVIS